MSGPGQSYSLSSTDVGDEFVSDCELLASRLANGLDGSDDTQGVKKACHWVMNCISEQIKGDLFLKGIPN